MPPRDVGQHPVPSPAVAKVEGHTQQVDNQRLVTPDGGDMRVVTREQHKKWINDRTPSRDADIRLTNQVLLSELEEWEERTHRQHTRVQETANLQQGDFKEWHQKGTMLLEKQQEGTRWEKMPELTIPQLIEELELTVSWDELQALRARFNDTHSCDFFFTTTLSNLIKVKDNERRAKKHLDDLGKVQDHNLNADFIRTCHELFELSTSKPMDVQAILKLLQQSDPIIKQLKRKVEQMNAQRLQALNEREDMAAAELIHNEIDDVLEDLVNVHLERLDLLLNSGQGEAFLERLDLAVQYLKKLLEDGRTDADDLIRRLMLDLCKSEEEVKARSRKKDEDELKMISEQSRCKQALQENSMQQTKKFEEIRKLYAELTALGDERKGLIDDLVHKKKEHENSIAAFEKFCMTSKEHQDMLDDLIKRLELTQQAYDDADAFMHETKEKVSKATDAARQETADILLKEQRDYYGAFREYYKTLGELLYAKERRAEEMEDLADCLKQKLKLAPICLDKNVQSYKEQMRDLDRARQQCDIEVDDLRERADRAVEDAGPTEEALLKHGDKLVSPAIELQESNVAKMAQVTDTRKALAQKKHGDVERQEQEAARSQQMAKQARASSGRSAHMRPLSPDPSRLKRKPAAEMTPEERKAQSDDRRRSYVDRLRRAVDDGDPAGSPAVQQSTSSPGGNTSRSLGHG